ncbi:hypothetical protein L1987_62055 [Smallanthus sonchifolius]|uniref:Uncharacterized protein n=1 Tax=Smallanthus sonchifolius TaxID=185202 RepID=A0ACB9C9B9_9ASTR|nr:hypothetical protein L1987_62055 [Smallanthus sonchifolius]
MDFRYTRPPPPAPPSSESHQPLPQQPVPPPPGTWYSGQFQYNSPSPPPPQWAPQPPHSDHHLPPPPPYAAAPPPPMPYSSNHYSIPPRPHMPPPPPPPPQHHYPPVNQEWSNPSWGHQGLDYSAPNKNEDDWAARARAWAAKKAVTDDQHQQSAPANLPEEINHQNQYSQSLDFQQHSLPPPSLQQYPSSFALPPRPPANHLQEPSSYSPGYATDGHYSYPARDGNFRDPAVVYPHQEAAPANLSVHQLEVPSSYSSVAGKEELSDMNRNFYQPSHMAFASAPQHHVQPSVSPNERSMSVEQSHYPFNNSSAESETDLSNQPLDFRPRYGHDHGSFGQSGVPGMLYPSMPPVHTTIQQADPSVGVSSPVSMHSTPLFGRISSFQPTIPAANATFPIGTTNAFQGDIYGSPGFPERPKKASVPNWLREEIIKKKAVIGSTALEVSRQDTESNEDEVMDQKGDDGGGKSMDSTRSAEEEGDDEDYVEAARTAAVNQEIKRILTEVLLKVTDELFDEIATNVLEEDDLNVEVEHKAVNTSAATTPRSTAKVIIPANTKGADADDASVKSGSSSPGDVLGLGSYASDDDEEEKEVQNSSIPTSNKSKPPVHLSENGSSQVDDGDVRGKKFLEESDSHKVSPNGAVESHNDRSGGEKVKPDSSDFSKSKHSVIESGFKAKNPLQNNSQGKISRNGPDKSGKDKKHNKVDENSRTHDERHIKREKNEDQSGSKEKMKDQDSGKRVSKAEVKDDKEERERDKRSPEKEESRKREKDDKKERSKYKPIGDSSRNKRYRSPLPGGRGRSSKDNSSVGHAHGSCDGSSDDSRRKIHSKRCDLSPSPVRSRRQVSRSPSKRSHRRHSIYSSLEATRERRRSRSRSRSRSRRG